MSNNLSLQELMDPKRLDAQARYENARYAVDMAYKYAKDIYPDDPPKVWKIGDDGKKERDWENQPEITAEERFKFYVNAARSLKLIIEADLNETLKVLDATNSQAAAS